MTPKLILLCLTLQWLLALNASAATPKYDLDGRVIGVTNSDGSSIDYPRDSNGNQIDRSVSHPVELILAVDPPGSGTITGAGRYPRNSQQPLTATAGGDFVFNSWKRVDGTVLSTSANYTHTVNAAETLTAHFRALSPEIVIEDTTTDPATNLADGTSTLVFAHPSPLTRTLTVRNVGTAPLTGLSATLDGPGVSLFSKTGLPTILAAGGSVSFTIQFSPITPVVSTAALHVLSNDADEGSFDLALHGTMPCPAITVLPPAASQGIVGTAINRVFTQSGGIGTVTFALASGSLPSGVTLSSNGTLAGVPSQTGSFPMTVSVTDSYGCTGTSSTYTLLISSGGPDGSLDSSFGSDGKTTTHFGSGGDIAFGVVLQPDGKAVAAGYAFHEGKKRFALARYNVDGTLDATFNSTGKVITSVSSGEDEAHCLALQPDGKIIAAGFTRPDTAEVALVRYHTNGTLDASFGSGGKVITPVAEGDDDARAILIQPDGKIVIVGYGYRSSGTNDVIVLRYNADGMLDNGFGTGGKLMFAFGGSYDNGFGAALQPDGKIIAVGSTYDGLDHWAIARITSNGTLDSSFDSDGKVTTSFATGSQSASSVAIQADGKIVVGGEADIGGSYNFALARYNSDGSLDTTFGSGGKVTTDWHGRMDLGRALAIQRDGKILLGGMARNPADKFNMAVARYLRDGSLDTSFGTVGKTMISVLGIDDRAHGLAIMPYGVLTLAGSSHNGSDEDFAIARVSIVVPGFDEDLNFDDNQLPAGWTLGYPNGPGRNASITEGRFDVRQVDTYSGLDKAEVVPETADRVMVSYTGNVTANYWGQGTQIRFISSDGDYFASFGKSGYGNNTMTATVGVEPTQPWPYQSVFPLVTGTYRHIAVFEDGRVTYTVRKMDSTIPLLSEVVQMPTLRIHQLQTLRLFAFTTTGDPSWIDDVSIRALPRPPEIVVEQPAGNILAADSSCDFGLIPPGSSSSLTFAIRNIGIADLSIQSITIDGADASRFTLSISPQSPLSGPTGTTTFAVQFSPGTPGSKTAVLHLANNDSDENPFNIILNGIGQSASQSWRQQHFGTTENTGNASDDAEPMRDGISNLMKFATGLDPTKTGKQPGAVSRDANVVIFSYPRSKAAVADGVRYTVEWSDELSASSWSSTGVTETVTDDGPNEQVTASIPASHASRKFVRLKVSR